MSGLETVRYEALVSFENAQLERSLSMYVILKKKKLHNKYKLSKTVVFTNRVGGHVVFGMDPVCVNVGLALSPSFFFTLL